ncbi:MAG: DUF6498-containing protein [Candidatus Diapherotrites archaeon]|nr:DUF6498-containing protein [Candidatus Diapherotrites archaeon]
MPSEEEMFAAYSQNRPPNRPLSDNPQGWTPTLPLSVLPWMLVSILAFLANHYYSYVYYKNKPSKKKHNIGTIFFYPYARIIPMHFLMVGGAIWTTGPEVQSVILFLVLKTCADLIMHYIEHHEGWI